MAEEETKEARQEQSPPDIGQGEEVQYADEFDLPIGSGEDIGDEPSKRPSPDTGQGGETLDSFMKKKGFRSTDDFVKSYADLERHRTALQQDVQRLAYQPPMPLPRPAPQPLNIPEDPSDILMDREKLGQFVGELREGIMRDVQQSRLAERQDEMNRRVMGLRSQNPEKFDRLQPFMMRLSGQFPTADLDQLYHMAEQEESNARARFYDEVRTEVLGGIDPRQLQTLSAKHRPAQVASGTGTPPGDARHALQRRADQLRDAIFNASVLDE